MNDASMLTEVCSLGEASHSLMLQSTPQLSSLSLSAKQSPDTFPLWAPCIWCTCFCSAMLCTMMPVAGWPLTDGAHEGLTAVPTTTGDDMNRSWFLTEHFNGIDVALQARNERFGKHPVHFGGIESTHPLARTCKGVEEGIEVARCRCWVAMSCWQMRRRSMLENGNLLC